MTPVDYLKDVVEPNLAALAADYGSIRHNLNAVHAVDALAAHIYYASNGAAPGTDDTVYRAELAKHFPEFALLRDIAKAIKHVRLIQGSPQTSRGDHIEVRSLGWDEAASGDGQLGRAATGSYSRRLRWDAGCRDGGDALEVLKAEMIKYGLNE